MLGSHCGSSGDHGTCKEQLSRLCRNNNSIILVVSSLETVCLYIPLHFNPEDLCAFSDVRFKTYDPVHAPVLCCAVFQQDSSECNTATAASWAAV